MCPVDFSESSTAALDDAASLAQQLGAQLLIVYVDEHPLRSGAASSSPSADADKRQLASLAQCCEGVVVQHHHVHGHAAVEIPRFARDHDVDLVVIGRQKGDSRFHDRLDGVCHWASRQCACPVLTVNPLPAPALSH
jgi:nucleotide-binding universal stress UspA family protein